VSLSRCRFAACFGRLPLAGLLGLLLAATAVLLLPAFALAFVSGDGNGCLCQSPQPPGDPQIVVALPDASHGWLGGGLVLAVTGCRSQAVADGALVPQGWARTAASVGRPPPLSDQAGSRLRGRDRAGEEPASLRFGPQARPPGVASFLPRAEGTMRKLIVLVLVAAGVILVASAALAACGSGTSSSSTPAGSPAAGTGATPALGSAVAGTIAFQRAGKNPALCVINTDGTGLKVLAAGPALVNAYPAWSPDGTRILYDSGSWASMADKVWVMNADGSGKRCLTPTVADSFPVWSPDGKQFAFVRVDPPASDFWLATANANGSAIKQLARDTSGHMWRIAWAPNGTFFYNGQTSIYTVAAGGSTPVQLTASSQYVNDFALSPDGSKLAIQDPLHNEIVVLPASGRGIPVVVVRNLSGSVPVTVQQHIHMTWSPDGTAIAFAADDILQPGSALYVVRADGSGLTKVPNTGLVYDPAWRP
jgi:TolB protein